MTGLFLEILRGFAPLDDKEGALALDDKKGAIALDDKRESVAIFRTLEVDIYYIGNKLVSFY